MFNNNKGVKKMIKVIKVEYENNMVQKGSAVKYFIYL